MNLNDNLIRCFTRYKEIEDYDFVNAGSKTGKEFRHFTQLVWKDTKRVGVGCAINKERGQIYIVAQYTPNGNVKTMYRNQVRKQTGKYE